LLSMERRSGHWRFEIGMLKARDLGWFRRSALEEKNEKGRRCSCQSPCCLVLTRPCLNGVHVPRLCVTTKYNSHGFSPNLIVDVDEEYAINK
jgi:hypothetical protein